jgi:uncharacterized protein HemY
MPMKYITLLFFLIALNCAADKFDAAIKLFESEKFQECNKILTELLDNPPKKLTKEKRIKAIAMQEYINSRNPENIEKILQDARKTAEHNNLLTKDLLDYASVMIFRAADWKERGIPEYQELSEIASKLLKGINDNGDASVAIKTIMLRVKNLNINGKYDQAIKIILETLQHYYPKSFKSNNRKLSKPARELLILLGEQYTKLGIKTKSGKDKIYNFTRAANYYLLARPGTPHKSDALKDLDNRLLYCQETLKLLGYKLQLPDKIAPRKKLSLAMVDEMLKQRRFHDIILALDGRKKSLEMSLRYAQALVGVQKYKKAVKSLKGLHFNDNSTAILLHLAHTCQMAGKKSEALEIYKLFAKRFPDSPDICRVYFSCANLSLDLNNFKEGAKYFILSSQNTADKKMKIRAIASAGECLYQSKEYQQCIDLMQKQEFSIKFALLKAQSALKLSNCQLAMKSLKQVLKQKTLTEEQRKNALFLAATSSDEMNHIEDTVSYFKQYMECYPYDEKSMVCVLRLLEIFEDKNKQSELFKLGNWLVKYKPESRQTPELIIRIAKKLTNRKQINSAYKHLLKLPKLSDLQLLQISKQKLPRKLKMQILNKHKVEFANTPEICEIYYSLSKLYFKENKFNKALECCEKLLKQKQVYRYWEVKLLQAGVLKKLKCSDEERRIYQELLLTKLPKDQIPRVVFQLAGSWKNQGEYKKALACAWTAVPIDGQVKSQNEKQQIQKILNLIIDCSKKAKSPADKKEAQEILDLISKDDLMSK